RYRLDHAIAEVVGMRAREAKPANSIHLPHCAKKIGEIVGAVGVGVHRLTEQHDLRHSVSNYAFGLSHHICKRATSFRTARVWHDAIRTPVIAATLHR